MVVVRGSMPMLQFIHQSVPDFLLQQSVHEALGISIVLSFRDDGLWMILDAISKLLFSPEFDFILRYGCIGLDGTPSHW